MRLHVVGTGCPDARAARFGSAFALEIGEEGYGCGTGCMLVDYEINRVILIRPARGAPALPALTSPG